jgi:hypothetical protein
VLAGAVPVAYVVTAHHTVVSMTPSRLAFLLPFQLLLLLRGCERRPRLGTAVVAGLVLTSLLGAASYHRQRDFLNKAYLVPFRAIAADAAAPLSRADALLVVDASNLDPTALLAALPAAVTALPVADDGAAAELRRRLAAGGLRRVWLLRNTHDVSPGRWSTRIATEVARSFRLVRRREYVPYGRADALAMRALGWPERPAALLELLEFEAPAPAPPAAVGPRAARAGRAHV